MLGYINDCIERLVVEKFGIQAWHQVKQKASCEIKDNGFLKLEHYSDKSTVALAEAAAEVSGLSIDDVYGAFGKFFVKYIIDNGYEKLICCQGSTLKDWMSNINAIHQHLQTTFPKKMVMPEFWCETNFDGTLTLFYTSRRGNFLAPVASGIVIEGASRIFDLNLELTMQTKQGVDGAKFTSWHVTTQDPNDIPKLSTKKGVSDASSPGSPVITTMKCPMSGMSFSSSSSNDVPSVIMADECRSRRSVQKTQSMTMTSSTCSSTIQDSEEGDDDLDTPVGGLSAASTRKLFPYHVMINRDFEIKQVGRDLPRVLGSTNEILCCNEIDEVFEFVTPKTAKWTRSWMRKLQDQDIVLSCSLSSAPSNMYFQGSIMPLSGRGAILILCPDAKSLDELAEMQLTLSDLPAHGSYRDAVFLREHLSRQMNNALHMEKLSRTLQTEKDLLESLIPSHAAKELRTGKRVQPMNHENVTLFFSDVVGFTEICKHLSPTQVIGMLNQLYGVMDFLLEKFGLFKVETIGDAYFCCSGLPEPDEEHASKVANFALAVQELASRVVSPLDGRPIKVRIGVHSGSCASGIVGHRNPRYCVFGDTVNTAARHESSSEPGRIHCSMSTMIELKENSDFVFCSRGMVNMKGKGELSTYWLEASASNKLINNASLEQLQAEAEERLKHTGTNSAPVLARSKATEEQSEAIHRATSQSSLLPGSSAHSSNGPPADETSVLSSKSRGSKSSTPSRKELARRLAQLGTTSNRRAGRRREGSSISSSDTGSIDRSKNIQAALDVVEEPGEFSYGQQNSL